MGMDMLLEAIDKRLTLDPVSRENFRLPAGEGRALHLLHERAAVISQEFHDEVCEVVADVPQSILRRLSQFRVTK
jgi:hypothetical protein